MVYLFSALRYEAQPLIRRLSLKQESSFLPFQVFQDPDKLYMLTLTGTGPIRAASAVSAVYALCPPGPSDLLVNIGICAGLHEAQIGQCFLCNRLENRDSGRAFYPDLIWTHGFSEACLVTGSRILSDPASLCSALKESDRQPLLYDMEAAAIYECASSRMGPHQMLYWKIVSDQGDGRLPSGEEAAQLIDLHLPSILHFLASIPAAGQTAAEPAFLHDLSRDMHCSETMLHTLRQYLTYDALSGRRCDARIQQMYADGTLPCKDKKEGKKILAKLYDCLL
jgi:nucleoside phosphorylase